MSDFYPFFLVLALLVIGVLIALCLQQKKLDKRESQLRKQKADLDKRESLLREKEQSASGSSPSPSRQRGRSLTPYVPVIFWKVRYPKTEFKACSLSNVAHPVPSPSKPGVYLFHSLSDTSLTYETSLHSCTCPSYTRTDSLQMRPCKHMIRLAIELGLYTTPRFPQNAEALKECIRSSTLLK